MYLFSRPIETMDNRLRIAVTHQNVRNGNKHQPTYSDVEQCFAWLPSDLMCGDAGAQTMGRHSDPIFHFARQYLVRSAGRRSTSRRRRLEAYHNNTSHVRAVWGPLGRRPHRSLRFHSGSEHFSQCRVRHGGFLRLAEDCLPQGDALGHHGENGSFPTVTISRSQRSVFAHKQKVTERNANPQPTGNDRIAEGVAQALGPSSSPLTIERPTIVSDTEVFLGE
jgi:hypothetical protein